MQTFFILLANERELMKKLWIRAMTREEQMLKADKSTVHAFYKGMVCDQRIQCKITRTTSWSIDLKKDNATTIMLLKK